MPATRAQSARPHQRYSPVAISKPADNDVIILSSDDEQPPKARASPPRRKRSKPKNRAPIPASADVVEISSGEEDIVITRARLPPHRQPAADVQLQRQLKEAQEVRSDSVPACATAFTDAVRRLQEIERLRKEGRASEKNKAPAAAPVDNKVRFLLLPKMGHCELVVGPHLMNAYPPTFNV